MKTLINEDLLLVDSTYSNNVFVHSNEPLAVGIIKEEIDNENSTIYINDEKGEMLFLEHEYNFTTALKKGIQLYKRFSTYTEKSTPKVKKLQK